MIRGEGHNHPLMAIWVESEAGKFIQTLYVAESIGKGVFQHGDASRDSGCPEKSDDRLHCPTGRTRGESKPRMDFICPLPPNPIPDAYTGPTPGQKLHPAYPPG